MVWSWSGAAPLNGWLARSEAGVTVPGLSWIGRGLEQHRLKRVAGSVCYKRNGAWLNFDRSWSGAAPLNGWLARSCRGRNGAWRCLSVGRGHLLISIYSLAFIGRYMV